MFQICLCDDNNEFLLNLNNKLYDIASKNNIDINIVKYSSCKHLLFDIDEQKNDIDIYFLDVLMDGFTGIEIANEIRKLNATCQIIFLTSSKDHVFDAFDVMPLHYLIKQELNNKKLEEIFMKAINIIKLNKKNLFTYKVGHSIKSIDMKKILFFEIKNRIVTIHLTDGSTDNFYFSMKNLVKEINNNNFMQIHRSFLVNSYYIKTIEGKNLALNDGTVLSISEKYLKNFKTQYAKFLLNDFNSI